MFSQQLDLFDEFIKISDQGTSQLHLVDEAPNVVVISHGHHHGFNSFSDAAQELAVLQMLHLIILFMSQNNQSFSCSIFHTSLECPSRCRSLNHLVDAADTIGRGLLIYHHTYTP
jgi:hypothetical protein